MWLLSFGSKLKAGWLWVLGALAAMVGALALLWDRERRARMSAEARAKVEADRAVAEDAARQAAAEATVTRDQHVTEIRRRLDIAVDALRAKQLARDADIAKRWNDFHGKKT